MKNGFNRNQIKVIAVISMLIDHVGYTFFPHIILFRIIGRLAFPIFSFFIAEGFYYTSNKLKYLLLLFIFATISQVQYYYLFNCVQLNVLFTFTFSVAIMQLIINIREKQLFVKVFSSLLLIILTVLLFMLSLKNAIEYGILGVVLPVLLWISKPNKILGYVFLGIVLLLISMNKILLTGTINMNNCFSLFSLLSIPLLMLYNGKRGNSKFKYLFYTFYPTHILFLLIIKLII